MNTFKETGLDQSLLTALDTQWYTQPTPIQAQAIPVILQGKDIFGCAQTGTGKTAAFSLPMLQILSKLPKEGKLPRIQALILTPTRELAIQIGENITSYGAHTWLINTVIYGGVSQVNQVNTLRKGVDILIATPGRLLDLIQQKLVNLHRVKMFVLDEADRMLDMGFINDVKKIIAEIPKQRQTLFFSATMAPSIMSLANTILSHPVHINIAPVSSTVDTVTQALYTVSKDDKKNLLLHLLQDKEIKSAVVFTKTKHGANKVEKILSAARISSAAIHGNKSQNARQNALANLKNGSIRILVATDIAARGIDIDELSHVIIYDVPHEPETYVHRIGRTGRAGMSGISIMFCDPEEVKLLRQIVKLINKEIPHVTDHPFHSAHSTTKIEISQQVSEKKPSNILRNPQPHYNPRGGFGWQHQGRWSQQWWRHQQGSKIQWGGTRHANRGR